MPADPEARFEVIAQTTSCHLDPAIAISAIQAGHCGIFDLEFADLRDPRTTAALRRFAKSCTGPLGLKLAGDDGVLLEALPAGIAERLGTVILTPAGTPALDQGVADPGVAFLRARGPAGLRILLAVTSPAEAALATAIGCDGIVAKGNEAGGRVGESTNFILLQRLRGATALPVWVQGGIGRHTIASAYAAGAAGVVLDHQLLLTRESRLPDALKRAVVRMDGSETQCLGDELCLGEEFGAACRVFAGPASAAFASLSQAVRRLAREERPEEAVRQWGEILRRAVTPLDPENSAWLFGQDAAFADDLARRFKTVPGVIDGLLEAVKSHIVDARASLPLAAGSPLAQSHGTEFPIVQGPMTRVSDRAEFALKVAEGGALPFLALALMRGDDIQALLEKTRVVMEGRPWGVGILAFVPPELQEEQLAVVHGCRPDFALLAGGRPEQAVSLEQAGIPTYLHVPSPGLLRLFLEGGARRFIFEGRECGGHVGPRTSFILWNQMIEVLLASIDRASAPDIHVLFAGGVHDALSSAMVAAAAAPLARLGCKIGVLVGTAYTLTHEAIAGGAVVKTFQEEVANCSRTVLLETGPGHAIRCVDTSFVAAFAAEKRRLLAAGESHEHMRDALEALNVGRLRVATKGVDRNPAGGEPGAPAFLELDVETQRTNGLYMIGQVALLHDRITSIRELHQAIADDGTTLLAAIPLPAAQRDVVLPPKPADVAIIGMGCILPKAPDLQSFWENILDQVDAIQEVPSDRWDWRRYFDPDKTARDKIYSKWGGFIDDVVVDPVRYGIPPAALKSIEPLQLLTLEAVRAALTDAGFPDGHIADPELRRRTSVILGVGGGAGALGQRYAVRSSLPGLIEETPDAVLNLLPEWTEDSFPGILMNVVAGRVANRFDLGGVNFTVDAACGSSLAAMRLAVQELTAGTSDMVVVGGCDAFQNPFDFVAFSKTQALSPRGKCRTFDASADGIAIGEGVALVVLRRATDAMRSGARIYARIQGVGGSSDGRDKSLTAPRPEGQALALRRAYDMANFSPATIGLVEAHGTGTVAGDRAEVSTLKSVYAAAGAGIQACAIGSVKSMIGHTKCASGTAGLIKAALALYHKVLPPTNNVETPNPEADFAASPFFVASEARPWIAPADGHPRRAGVSAFGFGGTNFHVALEEHDDGSVDPDRKVLRQRWPSELFLIAADSREKFVQQVDRLAAEAATAGPAGRELRELAQECALSYRAGAKIRLGMVAGSHAELAQRIEAWRRSPEVASVAADAAAIDAPGIRVLDPRGVYFAESAAGTPPRVAFLFPGQGAQYPTMLRDLAMHFEEVGETFAAADATLHGTLPERLSGVIFPPPAFNEDERSARRTALTRTRFAQPAIGAASVAMTRLLAAFGVHGEAAAGHSYGEYVALHYAGAFDEATLYTLSEARGRIMAEMTGDDPGTMASVAADAATIRRHLGAGSAVQVANRNAPDQTVIAGPRKAVAEASALLAAQGLSVKPIQVACGFHSPCVAPARDGFAAILHQTPIRAPAIPVYANMTASTYPSAAAEVVDLLADHLVSPVNFQDQIVAMHEAGIRVFVEVGPSAILSGLVGRILRDRPHVAIASDMSARPGLLQLQHALAQLAVAGVPVVLDRLFAGRLGDLAATRTRVAREAAAATAWMVNGSSARPAREAKQPVRPPARLPAPSIGPALSIGAAGTQPIDNPPVEKMPVQTMTEKPLVQALQPLSVADRVPTSAAATTGATAVMLQYQKLMESFVAAQQQIMVTYLKGAAEQRVSFAPALVGPALAAVAKAVPPMATSMAAARVAQPEIAVPSLPAASPAIVSPAIASAAAANGAAYANGHAAGAAPGSDHSSGPGDFPAPAKIRAATLDAHGVADTLIAMISERTGYPPEMLGLDLDIEADLGIDSIKRVEILGAFRQQHIGATTDQVRTAMEQITRRKTLREVVEGCHALLVAQAGQVTAGQVTAGQVTAGQVTAGQASAGQAPVAQAVGGGAHSDAPAPATTRVALDVNGVADTLIAMISERTGYPPEMLGLDLDIEADLGIDSIKRVEILGAFRQQHIGATTDQVRAAMEQITRRKTLREVVEGCHALLVAQAEPVAQPAPVGQARPKSRGPMPVAPVAVARMAVAPTPVVPTPIAQSAVSQFDDRKAPRFFPVPVRAEVSSRALRPGKGDAFLITDDEGGIATALAARLRAAGARPMLLRMGDYTHATGPDGASLDLSDLSAVKEFARRFAAVGDRVAGIFHCLPLRNAVAFDTLELGAWRGDIGTSVKSLFNLAAAFGETLDSHRAACAVAATRVGGCFGLDPADARYARPALAGVSGLLKAFDQEWTNTRCKCVDFDLDATAEDIVEKLLIEAGRGREEVEIGYRNGRRQAFQIVRKTLSTKGRPVLDIAAGAVILVTGGARGITAEVACALAERHRPVLVLCGSSALPPAAEDAATAGLIEARPLKAALIKRARDSGTPVAPAAIENAYRQLLKEREIRSNLDALRRSAAAVEYHQVDVRDEIAFGGLIDRLYATHGRIDGVIHGAGIVEDKLVRDKTGESFDRVVDTKTVSSFILSRRLRPASLKFLALFTSVAGTFGNRGQSDYGAANEILSKLALHLDRSWPGRVVAISWGPWDKAGMVTPEIKRQFETLGIEAVPVELGRWAFDAEIRFGRKGEAEPIWGVGPWSRSPAASAPSEESRIDWRHQEATGGTAQVAR